MDSLQPYVETPNKAPCPRGSASDEVVKSRSHAAEEADLLGTRKDSEAAEILDTASLCFAAGSPIIDEQRRGQFLRECDRFTLAEVQLQGSCASPLRSETGLRTIQGIRSSMWP
jgi:hypothetical protein